MFRKIVVFSGFFLLAGCSSLPDMNRIQGNMDRMVHHMGVMSSSMPAMVYNTARMANTAERMQGKSDVLMSDLQKKGGSAEKAIQNYTQAFLDNDKALIKGLQGIREELGELKQRSDASSNKDQSRSNAALQARINELEAKLATLSQKVDKIDKKSP
jgi:outer membrane murein-binding lipoprotein Lpp